MRTLSQQIVRVLFVGVAMATFSAHAFDPSMTDTAIGRAQAGIDVGGSAKPGEVYFAQGVKAVRAKDYGYALDRYKVSASWGYKPAQYNLGVIYFNGEGGVAVDRPLAMAWFALAAERGDRKFVDARELAYAQMSDAEFARANVLWRDMKQTYADSVALDRAKRRWVDVRNSETGSHLGATIGALAVGTRNMDNNNVWKESEPHGVVPTPNSITNTPAGITGAGAVDGSIVYRKLRSTNNPYEDEGTVTVRDIVPVGGDDSKQTSSDKKENHYF